MEMILCSCGCGKTRSKYKIRNGKEIKCESRYMIKGHSNNGKKFSKEHLLNMSSAQLGKKLSEKTRKKISEALKGENNPMYGKHHNEEVKQFISKLNTKEKVGYKRLHVRIRNKLPRPEYCQMCNKVP